MRAGLMTLSVIFYPYHFVRTILSMSFCPIPFCPYTILSIPFCLYTILSIPFCPYHFVRYHFVRSPLKAAVDNLNAVIKANFTSQLPATQTVYILNINALCLVDMDILITEYCKIAIQTEYEGTIDN